MTIPTGSPPRHYGRGTVVVPARPASPVNNQPIDEGATEKPLETPQQETGERPDGGDARARTEPKARKRSRAGALRFIIVLAIWALTAVFAFQNYSVIVAICITAFVAIISGLVLILSLPKPRPEWVKAAAPEDGASRWSRLHYKIYAAGLYRLPFARAPKINYPSLNELQDRQFAVASDAKMKLAIVGSKGGVGKTPTAAGISASAADSPPAGAVTLVDFDAGADSQAPDYFGVDPLRTMSVMEFCAFHKELTSAPTRRELPGAVIEPAFGVRIFSARPNQWPIGEQATETINGIAESTDITVIDCPPGADVAASVAARKAADIVVIPCLYDKTPSWRAVNRLLAKEDIRDRHGDVIVAISAVPAHLNTERTRYEFADKFGLPVEQVVIIEFSSHIHHHTTMVRNLIGERTWRAYGLIVTLAMERVAAKRNQTADTATPIPEGEL